MQTNEPDTSPATGSAAPVGQDKSCHTPFGDDSSTQTSHAGSRSLRGGTRRRRLCAPLQTEGAKPQAPSTRPTPLPKRPKGRLFVGLLLLLLCAALAHYVWDWRFRYEAHGVVQGRVIEVSPPWDGNVSAMHVREGDSVRQGQLLITFKSTQHQQQLARVQDELKLAQAKLEAEVSQLRWQSQLRGDRSQKALSEYYELWGELLSQRSQLAQAKADLERLETTRRKNSLAVSQKELEHARYRFAGQQAKAEKLAEAVGQLKKRVEIYDQFQDDATAQMRPELLHIENLQAELKRLRELVQQGDVRSPVNGTVVKVHRFAGDYAKVAQPVIEIVEDNSLEPVLYLPQDRADKWRAGDGVKVRLSPGDHEVDCHVTRMGEQMEPAPSNIERYYRKGEKLLPIFLEPERKNGNRMKLLLGSEIKLDQRWIRALTD